MPSGGVGLMSDKQLGEFPPRRGVSETPWSGPGAQLPARACWFAPDCEMCSWGRGFPGEVGVLSAPPQLPSGNVPLTPTQRPRPGRAQAPRCVGRGPGGHGWRLTALGGGVSLAPGLPPRSGDPNS